MKAQGRILLLIAASVSFVVVVLHVVIAIIGPSAYTFFGGERLARIAVSGSFAPVLQTLLLAAIHAALRPLRTLRSRCHPPITASDSRVIRHRRHVCIPRPLRNTAGPPDPPRPGFPAISYALLLACVLSHRLRIHCRHSEELGMASARRRDECVSCALDVSNRAPPSPDFRAARRPSPPPRGTTPLR